MPSKKSQYLSYSTDINPAVKKLLAKKRSSGIKKVAQTKQVLTRLRAIMGQGMPLGDQTIAGVNSFPGPDVTYSPGPKFISTPIVNLGCLNSGTLTDIVQVGVNWPLTQGNGNFGTGSGQPNLTTVSGPFTNSTLSGLSAGSSSTPFQATVSLLADQSVYNPLAVHGGYSPISLSQEGMLWTLWPLAKPTALETQVGDSETHFDQFVMGTSTRPNYQIGQMGYFINNEIMGYTPFGARYREPLDTSLDNTSENIAAGIQELNESLLMTTEQQVGIIVVKVSEQIARIYNPAAGIASSQRYLYVGYDGWAVVNTTANPMGPMAAQTYVSPRPATTVGENYQVVLPPNFPQTVYYKNNRRQVPLPEPSSIDGVSVGSALNASNTLRNNAAIALGAGGSNQRAAGRLAASG
jgi:hypothetical protein